MTGLLPFDLGITKPAGDRFLTPKFRRVCGKIRIKKLDINDAVELVAIMNLIPMKLAQIIFQWDDRAAARVEWLCGFPIYQELAAPLVQANADALSVDVGLAVIQAVRDAGTWPKPLKWPVFLTDTLRELRHIHGSAAEVARITGLSYDIVLDKTGRRDPKKPSLAGAMLAIG